MSQYASPRSPNSRRAGSGNRTGRPPARLTNDPLAPQLPLVSGRWLLWSLLSVFGGGLLLVYLTVCLLFWQGQWQILFHPARAANLAPAGNSLPVEDVRFGTTEAGQTRLHGWILKAAPDARYAGTTILYLHAMTLGSLAATRTELTALHALGCDVFAFDYRGFGESEAARPDEQQAAADAESAWQYLTQTRHVPPGSIVLYGVALGASLAADAAARHPEAAGLILDAPSPTALEIFRADPRSHWIPLRLLAHDRFDPRASLPRAKQPTLFLLPPASESPGGRYAAASAGLTSVVHLPVQPWEAQARQQALQRFLDTLKTAGMSGDSSPKPRR